MGQRFAPYRAPHAEMTQRTRSAGQEEGLPVRRIFSFCPYRTRATKLPGGGGRGSQDNQASKGRGHRFHIHTAQQGSGSEGMAEIMESEALQPGVFRTLLAEADYGAVWEEAYHKP